MKILNLKLSHLNGAILSIFIITASLYSYAKETIYLSERQSYQHKIAIVTNRLILHVNNDSILYESHLDPRGEVSYLTASYGENQWSYVLNSSLEEIVDQDFRYENWVIFVHGDGKDLKSAVKRAREISELHKVNVLAYAWPSSDPELGAIKNFKNSHNNVEKATPHFGLFLKDVACLRNSSSGNLFKGNVSMFMHSLGNYYLENLVKQNLHKIFEEPFIENLIINAAAVEQSGHNQWVEKLNFQKRIFINSNGKDMNLIGLRIFSKNKMQLGEDPEPPFASNAIYVSFTEAVGASLPPGPSHSYFFASVTDESQRISFYYTQLFNGMEIDFNNPNLFIQESEYLSYSILF